MDKRHQYDRYEDYSQDSIRYTSMEEAKNEVLVLTIDIGDGRKDELSVKEDDDPHLLAENFCKKHKLSIEVKQALIEQIEQNLELHVEDDISTFLSVNKSYDSKAKKSNQESVRSSSGIGSENTPIPNKQIPPVYERKNKKLEEIRDSKETVSFKNNSVNNYGEKLYLKGIRFIENTNKKKLNYIEERKQKEMQDTTFRPRINSKNSENSERQHVQELLLRKGREKQEHIERKRGEKLAEELSACTFSPFINKSSEKTLKNDESSPNRFMRLYENAKATQNKIKMINDK